MTERGESHSDAAAPRDMRYAILPDRMPKLSPDEMTDAQKKVAAEISAGKRGEVRGPYWAILRSPGLMSPMQKIGYMVGKWQIMRLLGRYHDQQAADFRLGAFHDQLISYGSLPTSVIEWLMLGDSAQVMKATRMSTPLATTSSTTQGRQSVGAPASGGTR